MVGFFKVGKMSVQDKLKAYMLKKGLTQFELGELLEVSRASVGSWLLPDDHPNHRNPSTPQRKKICELLNITDAELFTIGSISKPAEKILPVIPSDYKIDPAVNNFSKNAEEFIPSPFDINGKNAFAFRITGERMAPRYFEGDYVVACTDITPSSGEAVLVKVKDKNIMCGILSLQPNSIFLIPANPKSTMETYPADKIEWIYPIKAMYRNEN